MTGRRGRRRKQIMDDLKDIEIILEIESGSTISPSIEKSRWKKLWTCRKGKNFRLFFRPDFSRKVNTFN